MSRGINKVMIVGNLGGDPETRYMQSGTALAQFSVAVSESWKDKNTGETKERTEWITVEAWGRLAEVCSEYLTKGKQVYVEGKLQTDSWDDKDTGQKRYKTKVHASNVLMLGSKEGGNRNQRASDRQDQDGMPPRSRSHQDEFDDDIPF